MASRRDDRLSETGAGKADELQRALTLLRAACEQHGGCPAAEHGLPPDSCAVWELAERVAPGINGPCVAGRCPAEEDARFAEELAARCADVCAHDRPPGGLPEGDDGLRCRIAEERAKAIEEGGGDSAAAPWPAPGES